jgi:multicomponent K+:H+ antiporter subunit E
LVLKDIVVANFTVARVVLGPSEAVRPVFVAVPLEVRDDFPLTLLASVISLTPGTVSADLAPDRSRLWVHALSEENPEQLVQQIKHRYETPIREIFGC